MSMNFKEFIETDREKSNTLRFEGSFLDYLELVKEDPEVVILAHKRLYDMINNKGVEELKAEENPRIRKIYGNDLIRKYGFFKDEFYGIDKVIMKLASYFKSAAMKGEESRQVLYLVGPVGAGKSSIVESLKSALEDCEPVYALKGCPMHEEPLHLIPKHLRPKFEEMLGVQIEGDLCPVCKYRLTHDLMGYMKIFQLKEQDFLLDQEKE